MSQQTYSNILYTVHMYTIFTNFHVTFCSSNCWLQSCVKAFLENPRCICCINKPQWQACFVEETGIGRIHYLCQPIGNLQVYSTWISTCCFGISWLSSVSNDVDLSYQHRESKNWTTNDPIASKDGTVWVSAPSLQDLCHTNLVWSCGKRSIPFQWNIMNSMSVSSIKTLGYPISCFFKIISITISQTQLQVKQRYNIYADVTKKAIDPEVGSGSKTGEWFFCFTQMGSLKNSFPKRLNMEPIWPKIW